MTTNPNVPHTLHGPAPPTSNDNTDSRRGLSLSPQRHHTTSLPDLTPSYFDDPPSPSPSASPSAHSASASPPAERRNLRKPSPALLARLKLFDIHNKSRVVSSPALCQDKIGRIPESQLRELDELHSRGHSIRVERRGRAWTGSSSSPALLTPQRTGESAPDMDLLPPPPELDSDQSSIISTSDRIIHSDSEQSEDARDNQKFRLPELDKARSRSTLMNEVADDDSDHSSRPPTPPPKDPPPVIDPPPAWRQSAVEPLSDLEAYLRNRAVPRANSIYTLSRVSFTNQIQQLTSIKLPDAATLSTGISAIPTSIAAGRALADAAISIKQWMQKASEVLNGLDAEDDVEWAAAAGREGLDEVDAAITLFESLITVYIIAIEELQTRPDISSLSAQDLQRLVEQMEDVVGGWSQIKKTLKNVKEQVEVAMEWEELWNSVLGEIGMELDGLSRLIFEMEERRHRVAFANAFHGADNDESIEIGELETIVEEAPKQNVRAAASNRFSFTPAFGSNSPLLSPNSEAKQEDSNLLKLFARMQPLRASLDFLPMRLAGFENRAMSMFPSACGELDTRREQLERQWGKLEADAEALRRELGEDRWIHLFRNAAGKALSMWQSHTRSINKLRKAFEEGADPDYITMKLRTYEEKKPHYPPAIERVLAIIDKGVKDRLTVNGEIIRLQEDIRQKLSDLYADIKNMDAFLEENYFNKTQQLRDSISSILSTERSFASSAFDTPGSSPASSVVMMSRKGSDQGATTPYSAGKSRKSSFASSSRGTSTPSARRLSSLPVQSTTGASQGLRKTPVSRSSANDVRSKNSSSPVPRSPIPRITSSTPTPGRRPALEKSTNKPRWNSSTNVNDLSVGHNFKPLTLTTPSPYRKQAPTPKTHPPRPLRNVSSHSSIPVPSPLSRNFALSPPPQSRPARPASTTPAQQAANRLAAPSPISTARRPSSSLRMHSSLASMPATPSTTASRRSSALFPVDSLGEDDDESPTLRVSKVTRPASALAGGRRTSMLPQPKGRVSSSTAVPTTGRTSRSGARSRMDDDKPRWKF